MFQRRLSQGLARRCATGQGKICHCRCKGKLHGLDHTAYRIQEAAHFHLAKAENRPVTESEIMTAVDNALASVKTSEATAQSTNATA